jgi:hypothetical protein
MDDAERFSLLGTYRTPRFRIGQRVRCQVRGEVAAPGRMYGSSKNQPTAQAREPTQFHTSISISACRNSRGEYGRLGDRAAWQMSKPGSVSRGGGYSSAL